MGETGFHVATILHLIGVLQTFFRKRNDVLVGGNQFMYWEADDPTQVAAPDVYVIFGVSPEPRRTIKTWVEGKAPDVIFEITSRKTKSEDIRFKRALYEELGVKEYFLFDPENDYLRPPLQGFRLVNGHYVPLTGETLHSELLGIHLRVVEGELRLFNAATGEVLLDEVESADLIDEQAETIEAQASQLEAARRQAEAAEAELARLRAELEKLRRTGAQ